MHAIFPPLPLMNPGDRQDRDDAKALIALYDRTVDAVKGYDKMVEKADPAFRDTADRFRTLHARHAKDLQQLFSDLGIETDADGSLMGTVNQAVVTFRAFFDEIDEDVMDQVRSGEDWVLKAFEDAFAEQDTAVAGPKLRAMQAELIDLLVDTRHLG